MHILGRNNRVRRQNAGNICLFVFLVFFCTAIFSPVAAPNAYATSNPSTPLTALRNVATYNDGNNTVSIYLLLQPTTPSHFDSVYVDLSQILGTSKTVKAVYAAVYDQIYGNVYGYLVDQVYNVSPTATVYTDRSAIAWVRTDDQRLVQTEFVKLVVKPPNQSSAAFSIVPQQNLFLVGTSVSMDIHLASGAAPSGADFILNYDPAKLQVNSLTTSCGPITVNSYDNVKGVVDFAVASGSGLPLSADLATVCFNIVGAGATKVMFAEVAATDMDNHLMACSYQDLAINTVGSAVIEGKVNLVDWTASNTGLTVGDGGLYSSFPDNHGNYQLRVPAGTYNIKASFAKHLTAIQRSITVSAGDIRQLSDFRLLSGDANGDNQISLMDLVILASVYPRQTVGSYSSDFNGDGLVDLLDLAVLARNYRQVGDN